MALALAIIISLLWLALSADAATLHGLVTKVADGDTITVQVKQRKVSIRLGEIDCPELAQPHGRLARQYTADQVLNQPVTVYTTEIDRYGRHVGEVILPDGSSLNQHLVYLGHCWNYYPEYSDDPVLALLEKDAREAQRGLWIDPDPIRPSVWRAKQKQAD